MYVCPDLSPPKLLDQWKNVTVRTYHKLWEDKNGRKNGQKMPKRAKNVFYLISAVRKLWSDVEQSTFMLNWPNSATRLGKKLPKWQKSPTRNGKKLPKWQKSAKVEKKDWRVSTGFNHDIKTMVVNKICVNMTLQNKI